uniref:Uncharacterized protein n=1 Tax=Tanacetum cinerariifolium TaxID=118510 RepID=A0A6L2MJ32_TANCI|nr:hypothetical protein [Tanacetum cinerariifolium]
MTLLNKLMETCATLTQKVAHLEHDKVAQALEITKLKKRIRKLEKKRRSKNFGLKRLMKRRMEEDVNVVKEVNAAEPTVFDDEEEIEQAATRERQEKKDLEKAKVLQQQYDQKQENIDWNVVVEQMQEKHLDDIKKYQRLKKPIFVTQARKNMIVYLKNIAGYKIQHFKDRDEEPTKKRAAKDTSLQESFKRLREEVEVLGSHSTQQEETPTVDPTEISKEDV